jgi:hypothetical protein
MEVPKFNRYKIKISGYEIVPIHCDDTKTIEEYVRPLKSHVKMFGPSFPRFHIKLTDNGWDIHLDKYRNHGFRVKGSVIDKGYIIEDEIKRIKNIKEILKARKEASLPPEPKEAIEYYKNLK